MGEIADMMCDGTLDAYTGEYLGQGGGFPRYRNYSGKVVGVYDNITHPRLTFIELVRTMVIQAKIYTKWYKAAWEFLKTPEKDRDLSTKALQQIAGRVIKQRKQFEQYLNTLKTST